jgi:hypothetical protein
LPAAFEVLTTSPDHRMSHLAKGGERLAEPRKRYWEDLIRNVERALAIHADPSIADGEIVYPFEGEPSRYQPTEPPGPR